MLALVDATDHLDLQLRFADSSCKSRALVDDCLTTVQTYIGLPTPGTSENGCSAMYRDDGVLVFGGWSSYRFTRDVSLYNITTNRWLTITTFEVAPSPRGGHVCATIANGAEFLVHGGSDDHHVFADTSVLDMATLTWRTLPAFAPPRTFAASGRFSEARLVRFLPPAIADNVRT